MRAFPRTGRPETRISRCARTDIGFRGLQAVQSAADFRAARIDRDRSPIDSAEPGLGQHCWMTRSVPLVLALAELMVPDPPLRIDEVERRPVPVLEGTPIA